MKFNKKEGYTILESLLYISITCVIFLELLTFYISFYKSYEEIRKEEIFLNNINNFYINLDNVTDDYNIKNMYVSQNKLYILKDTEDGEITQIIYKRQNDMVIKYLRDEKVLTVTKMLTNIKDSHILQKDKLIYVALEDDYGRKYIRCI